MIVRVVIVTTERIWMSVPNEPRPILVYIGRSQYLVLAGANIMTVVYYVVLHEPTVLYEKIFSKTLLFSFFKFSEKRF